jgi:hypothetical protein
MSGYHEIWLYGSRARGTADDVSDTDLLVVGSASGVACARTQYAYPRIAVSHYEWSEVEVMHSYGSLFLHHLSSEGIRLEPNASQPPSRLERQLSGLPQFTRAEHDLVTFRRACQEARRSLMQGGWPDLELQVMATVVRHAAILGCYCAGEPDYGRETPFATLAAYTEFDQDRLGRLAALATRFRYMPLGHERWIKYSMSGLNWLDEVERFIDILDPLVYEYEALLRSVA